MSDRKREASSSSLQVSSSSKKMKVSLPVRPTGLPSTLSADRVSSQPTVEPWEALILECEPQDLFDQIMTNSNAGNTDRAVCYNLRLYVIILIFIFCRFLTF